MYLTAETHKVLFGRSTECRTAMSRHEKYDGETNRQTNKWSISISSHGSIPIHANAATQLEPAARKWHLARHAACSLFAMLAAQWQHCAMYLRVSAFYPPSFSLFSFGFCNHACRFPRQNVIYVSFLPGLL